jgi:hypothetical protein
MDKKKEKVNQDSESAGKTEEQTAKTEPQPQTNTQPNNQINPPNLTNFIYIPSIDKYIGTQKIFCGLTWDNTQKELV